MGKEVQERVLKKMSSNDAEKILLHCFIADSTQELLLCVLLKECATLAL